MPVKERHRNHAYYRDHIRETPGEFSQVQRLFTIRVSGDEHLRAVKAARSADLSLNEFCLKAIMKACK